MERPPERHTRLQNGLAALIVVAFVALAWQAREPLDLEGVDEASYYALGQSIEQGTYREIFQEGAPLGAKYPPAYPAFQVVIRTIAGPDTDRLRLANILLVAAGLTLCFLCVRDFASGWMALGMLLVTAFNPFTLIYAGSLMSEASYLFLTCAALYAAFMAQQSRRWGTGLAIAATLLAFLTRTAGLTIVVAMAIWFATQRPRRELIVYLTLAVIVVGGWFAYLSMAADGGGSTYGRDIAVAGANSTAPVAVNVVGQAARSAYRLATGTAVTTLGLPTVQGTRIDNAAWLAAVLILVPAGLLVLWKSWRAMALYVVLYCGLMLLWPYPSGRLLSVIGPCLKLAMLLGMYEVAKRLHPRAGVPAVLVLVGLFVTGAINGNLARYRAAAVCDRSQPLAANACHNPVEHAMINAANHLITHSSPSDLVVTSKGASLYYLSKRATVPSGRVRRLFDGQIVDTLRAYGIKYVLLGQFIASEDGRLAELLMPRCRDVRVEWSGLPAGLLVSILPPGETSDDACSQIDSFRQTVNSRDQQSADAQTAR